MAGLKTEFIKLTLSEMCEAIRCGRYQLYPRKENLNTFTALGIMPNQAFDEMLSLSAKDYYSGPDQDWGRPNDPPFWVFKKIIQNELVYIKFKMITIGGEKILLVISFHIDRK